MFAAMLGDLGIQWQVPSSPREEIPPPENIFVGGGKMIRYKDKKPFDILAVTAVTLIIWTSEQVAAQAKIGRSPKKRKPKHN